MALQNVSFGDFHPTDPIVNAIIESPTGSQHKYEIDTVRDVSVLDGVLYDDLRFPFNYGYIPKTEAGDGEHLDVFVISTHPIDNGTVVPCRPIGMIAVTDRGKEDNKILAIPVSETKFSAIADLKDLPEEYIGKLRVFYEKLPVQWNRSIFATGFYGKERAIEELRKSQILD